MINNKNNMLDLLKSNDVIVHILSQIKNVEERNALDNFLKKAGIKDHPEMEYTFALWYLNSDVLRRFIESQSEFINDMNLKIDEIDMKVGSLSILLDEKHEIFRESVTETVNHGSTNLIDNMKALSSYVVELTEKQEISKAEVNKVLSELLKDQLDGVFAKMDETLEAKVEELILVVISKRLQKNDSEVVTKLYKEIKALNSKVEASIQSTANFTNTKLIGIIVGSGVICSIATQLIIRFFH